MSTQTKERTGEVGDSPPESSEAEARARLAARPSEAVKKLLAGDRQSIMNMRS